MTTKPVQFLCKTVQRWMSSHDQHRNTSRKTRVTVKRIGTYSIIVTFIACGSLLWIEIETIRGKLSSSGKLGVFDFDKSSNPYIYIQAKEIDLRNKSQDIKKKYLNPEKIKQESWFPWLQSHSQDPWTLLKLTRSADRKTRWLGVKAIAEMEDWEDYQYRYITQACDGRTLVGLARSQNVGDRFFLPLAQLQPLKRGITAELRSLLTSLPLTGVDICTEYFTSLALEKGQAMEDRGKDCIGKGSEMDLLPSKLRPKSYGAWWSLGGPPLDTTAQTPRQLPEEILHLYYLEALEAHSHSMSQCHHLVQEGAVHILLHLVSDLEAASDPYIPRQISRIIGNLCLCPSLHEEIIRTGWVPILSQWMSHPDHEVSHQASRCLMNLDRDFTDLMCDSGVYVIHPVHRKSEPSYCDVVFVHGIMGGPFKTWRQRDVEKKNSGNTQSMCWPKDWLASDCPNTRILTVEYDTHVSEWYVRCPHNKDSRTIENRGLSLLEKLHKAGVGSRPVVWVGHSMGGLLIKQLLSVSETDPRFQEMVSQTKGVVFYSVPHHGSTLADTSNQAWFLVYPSVEVQELSKDSPKLEALHDSFVSLMKKNSVPCLSFGETYKTSLGKNLPKVHIVAPQSSNPGIGEFHTVEADHINICKPEDQSSDLYTLPLKLIKHTVLQSKVERFLKAGITFDEITN